MVFLFLNFHLRLTFNIILLVLGPWLFLMLLVGGERIPRVLTLGVELSRYLMARTREQPGIPTAVQGRLCAH